MLLWLTHLLFGQIRLFLLRRWSCLLRIVRIRLLFAVIRGEIVSWACTLTEGCWRLGCQICCLVQWDALLFNRLEKTIVWVRWLVCGCLNSITYVFTLSLLLYLGELLGDKRCMGFRIFRWCSRLSWLFTSITHLIVCCERRCLLIPVDIVNIWTCRLLRLLFLVTLLDVEVLVHLFGVVVFDLVLEMVEEKHFRFV